MLLQDRFVGMGTGLCADLTGIGRTKASIAADRIAFLADISEIRQQSIEEKQARDLEEAESINYD